LHSNFKGVAWRGGFGGCARTSLFYKPVEKNNRFGVANLLGPASVRAQSALKRTTLICCAQLSTTNVCKKPVVKHDNRHISAAEYLRRQAEAEEASTASNAKSLKNVLPISKQETPWTGEENVRDAVLRMLTDSYKPLRVEGWQRKLQEPTERPLNDSIHRDTTVTTKLEEHKEAQERPKYPWEVSYKAPKVLYGLILILYTAHAFHKHHVGIPSVRSGLLVPKVGSKKRNLDIAARVALAREKTVDYVEGDRSISKADKYRAEHVSNRILRAHYDPDIRTMSAATDGFYEELGKPSRRSHRESQAGRRFQKHQRPWQTFFPGVE